MVCAVIGLYTYTILVLAQVSGTSSIDWVNLSRFYLKMEIKSSFRNVVFRKINRTAFLDKYRTMDNVQKHNICTNVPSSQTFRSYGVQMVLPEC
jgi:uncharacterized membrane protein (Fun14 family)